MKLAWFPIHKSQEPSRQMLACWVPGRLIGKTTTAYSSHMPLLNRITSPKLKPPMWLEIHCTEDSLKIRQKWAKNMQKIGMYAVVIVNQINGSEYCPVLLFRKLAAVVPTSPPLSRCSPSLIRRRLLLPATWRRGGDKLPRGWDFAPPPLRTLQSLRKGAATEAARLGGTEHQIKALRVWWNTDRRYVIVGRAQLTYRQIGHVPWGGGGRAFKWCLYVVPWAPHLLNWALIVGMCVQMPLCL